MATVVVLGASDKPHRYSHRAQLKLTQHGHRVIPVAKKGGSAAGVACLTSLSSIDEPVDTVTLYINPGLLRDEMAGLLALHPRRVIFNPGTECADCQRELAQQGIEVVQDCTLIMLDSGYF